MKKITLLFILFITLSVSSQTFNGATGAIPDNNCDVTNEFVVAVTGVGVLGAGNSFDEVAINITHTFDGDLDITLIAPNATALELSTDNGGSGDNYIDTHFSYLAGTSITAGSAPFTGSFLPEGDLSILNGVNADGNWILRVCDDAGSDTGTLDSWSITFIPTPTDTPGWYNIQWINDNDNATGSDTSLTVDAFTSITGYARVWADGVTNAVGQGAGIECWFGGNGTDTDPSTWPLDSWEMAVYQGDDGTNNDEYKFDAVADFTGTVYVAARWRLNGGPYVYGGFPGPWDGTTNNSIELISNPLFANDDCAGAIALTVNADLACSTVTSGTTVNAARSESDDQNCSGNANDDVWFSFVATSENHAIEISNVVAVSGTSTDMYFEVLEGTCGSLTSLLCSDPNTGSVLGLTISNTYLIRVYSYSDTSSQTFDVCVGIPPPPPANDDCVNAITITASVDNSCANAVSGTTVSATNSADYSPSCGATYNEVWYTFTPGTSEIFNITRTINSGTGSTYLSIWTGSCGSLTRVNASCFSTSLAESLTSGTTYLISVATADIGAVDFDLCIYPNPPAPANDECGTATALTVNADLNCGSFVSGTVASATASVDAEVCTGTYDDDVWYSFVAVGTEHVIQVNNIAGSTTDLVFQLAEGTCGSLTELGCYDTPNSGFTATGLTPTNTYYVRVATWSSSAQTTSFDICIGTEAAIVPNYLNDFSTYPGTGWSEALGAYGTPTGSSSDWTSDDFGNDSGHVNGQSARVEIWSTTKDEYLISPAFDLSASDYYLNFDIALTEWNNTNAATLGVDDYVALLVTEDGSTWTELTRWDSSSSIATSRQPAIEILLSGYGADVKFAFYAFSDTTNEDNNFYVDNFQITTTTLGIGENTIEGITMYPNPTKDVLHLSALESINTISIYNLLGQEIIRVQPNTIKSQVDISNLSTGMYVVKVQVGDKIGTYRIIKQ